MKTEKRVSNYEEPETVTLLSQNVVQQLISEHVFKDYLSLLEKESRK